MFYIIKEGGTLLMYNNNYNYPNQQLMGQMYGNRMPQNIPFTQPLKDEDVKELQKNDSLFSLKVTTQELNRAICTHKYPNTNKFAVDVLPNGDMVCAICGARFNPDQLTPEEVEKTVKDFENILQSCKLMYLNIPENVVKQFFSMIPFVQKTPQLYKISAENYQRFAPAGNTTQDVYQTNGVYNAFRQVVGGGFPGMNYGMPQYNQYQGYGMMNNGYPQNGGQMNMGNPYTNMPNQYTGQQMMNQPQFGNTGFGFQDPNVNPFYTNSVPVQSMGQPVAPPTQPQMVPPVQPQAPQMPTPPTAPQGNTAVERVNATATLDA